MVKFAGKRSSLDVFSVPFIWLSKECVSQAKKPRIEIAFRGNLNHQASCTDASYCSYHTIALLNSISDTIVGAKQVILNRSRSIWRWATGLYLENYGVSESSVMLVLSRRERRLSSPGCSRINWLYQWIECSGIATRRRHKNTPVVAWHVYNLHTVAFFRHCPISHSPKSRKKLFRAGSESCCYYSLSLLTFTMVELNLRSARRKPRMRWLYCCASRLARNRVWYARELYGLSDILESM